ncbi:MAG: alpha/beta hydrolase [Parvibaculaceae bacterium]|nr:alpha/beta hydrolase [Parvibaculaceae bacterium]
MFKNSIGLKAIAAVLLFTFVGIGALYLISNETVQIDTLRQQGGISTVADLSNGKTHYQLEGPESGDLVFLIHGGREPAWTWDEVVPRLHEAGYRTLRYDMFGRGYSDRPQDGLYDQAFFERQALELLEALDITQPIHIVGYSFGAAIAARVTNARASTVQSLSLLAPRYIRFPVPSIVRVPILGDVLMRYYVKPNALSEVRQFFTDETLAKKYAARVGTPMGVVGNDHAFSQFVLSDALSGTRSIYEQLGSLHLPVLLVSGSEDQSITPAHINGVMSHIPQARQIYLANADHGLVWTHGRQVATEIIHHLEKTKFGSKFPPQE